MNKTEVKMNTKETDETWLKFHKRCACGKWAILWGDGTSKDNPKTGRRELGKIWKCACGYEEQAPPYIAETDEENFRANWDRAQE